MLGLVAAAAAGHAGQSVRMQQYPSLVVAAIDLMDFLIAASETAAAVRSPPDLVGPVENEVELTKISFRRSHFMPPATSSLGAVDATAHNFDDINLNII